MARPRGDGRQLRLRIVTIDPGGVVAVHSHRGRPTVAHLVNGVLTERREGDWTEAHPAGNSWTEGRDVTHWAENRETVPAVIVAADVFKP